VSSHVNRKSLEGAIKRGEKNPHAAFTGKVEEWVNSREIPKGAVEIDYWVDSKSKNADGSPKYTPETTGFWYVKDGTYRDFIGASDAVGIGGIKGEDRARTYAYGDVELGEVNPHVKGWAESRKLDKAHRLIHESRGRQRPFELAKHGDHDQLSHGNWSQGRVAGSNVRGIPVPDGYVVLSAAERRYLARLPELRQGTLMRPLPISGGERARPGQERVSVEPSDFVHVYETNAGMVIDSAEPMDLDDYASAEGTLESEAVAAEQLAKDIFEVGVTLFDGRTIAVETNSAYGETDYKVEGDFRIVDVATGAMVGSCQRTITYDPMGHRVYNNVFKLDEDYQGVGLGTTLIRHWEDQMAKAGVEVMDVHAVSGSDMNGGYTWLRYGYTPNNPVAIVRYAPLNDVFFPADVEGRLGDIVRRNNVAITNKALDMAIDNYPGMNIGVNFSGSLIETQVSDEITRRITDLKRQITLDYEAGSTLFTTADDVLDAPRRIRDEYKSILTSEIPVDVSVTVRPTDQPFDDRSLDEARTVRIGVSAETFMPDAEIQEDRFYDYLKGRADWYGEKPTSELNLQPKERAVIVRADVIDRDGDGIIFEGTQFERRIGTASRQVAKGKAKKKKLRGPAKPSSLSELARWWADNDPAAWEQDAPEVRASYRRFLNSKVRADGKLKKHATHDQRDHGNWARNLRIFRHIMENEGATFDNRTREFKQEGFAVADPAQAYEAEEKHVSSVFAEEGRKLIGEFIKQWKDELAEPNKYVGAWLDNGNYYLDVATVVMDRSKAVEMGKETDQIAIWDLGANAEVRLRKAGSRVLLVPGDALNEETIELLFNELMRLNDE
jgi:GNAT superfamily N-acetyltransferase